MRKIPVALAAAFSSAAAFAADIVCANAEKIAAADGGGSYYKWSESGTLTVPAGGKTFDILLVGGGGAGGFARGGGGGGGGVVYRTGVALDEGVYTITVGAGGVPDSWASHSGDSCYKYSGSSTASTDGGSTVIRNSSGDVVLEAFGGGGGGTFISGQDSAFAQYGNSGAGRFGACGGGSAGKDQTEALGTQGGNGGKAFSGKDDSSGGGGGAGGNGYPATASNVSGNGGDGASCPITGEFVVYGGGGGAGVYSGTAGTGGAGGGGNGGNQGGGNQNSGMTAGVDGFGGGGGGASGSGNKWASCGGAPGGSGVFILREADDSLPVLVAGAVVASQTGAVIPFTVGHSGSTGEETVSIYVGITLSGNQMPELVREFYGLHKGDSVSYEASNLQPGTEYTVYFQAVNSAGIESGAASRVSFETLSEIKVLGVIPGYPYWPAEDMNAKNSTTDFDDCRVLFDGDTSTFCSRGTNHSGIETIYDAGTAHGISKLRFYPWNGDSNQRPKDFILSGSADGIEWTELYNQGGVKPDPDQWHEKNIGVAGKFRYFKLTQLKYCTMKEFELLSSDVLLKVNRPVIWRNASLGAEDEALGVMLSGELVNTQQAQASVYGYFATSDYGDDADAWAAHGVRFTVGSVGRGEKFSKYVAAPGTAGVYYLRLFADDGTESAASQRTEKVVVRSKACYPTAYTDSAKDAKWYNGNTGDYRDENASHSIVFDLSTLPTGSRVVSLRVWPRNDGIIEFTRCRPGKIYTSSDSTAFSEESRMSAGDRDVYAVSSSEISAVNWTQLLRFQDQIFDFEPRTVNVHEIVLDNLPKDARYLKIDRIAYDQVREFEFRTVKSIGTVIVLQ